MPETHAGGHPAWVVVGLNVVGVMVPVHEPLSVQASLHAVPVLGMYPASGQQPLAALALH